MRLLTGVVSIVGVLILAGSSYAAMDSASYQIEWDTVGNGGSDLAESGSYRLRDTLGNTAIGNGTSGSYQLRAGYRQGVYDQLVSLQVLAQSRSSGRAATAVAGTTVTTNPNGLVVGDFIALIQDEGAAQVAAVGKVSAVGAGDVTVSGWTDGGVAPVINGVDDYVYELTGSTASLGELDPGVVSTAIVMAEVSADLDTGYVAQVLQDEPLTAGAATISPVGDGTVSAGSEEYGARSSDASVDDSTFDTADTAFLTTYQPVTEKTAGAMNDRSFLTLKASISALTEDGTYQQTLSYIVSGRF